MHIARVCDDDDDFVCVCVQAHRTAQIDFLLMNKVSLFFSMIESV